MLAVGATKGCPVIGSGLPRSLAKNLARDFTIRSNIHSVGVAGVAATGVGVG